MPRLPIPPSGAHVAAALLACTALALATLDARVAERRAGVAQARAEDDWFAEFEAVCSRTQDAMTIPTDELRALVARCEQLKPRIAALDPSRKKVYSKRLQLCRDLFQFVLETRDPK